MEKLKTHNLKIRKIENAKFENGIFGNRKNERNLKI